MSDNSPYTREELEAACLRLLPEVENLIKFRTPFPKLLKMVAAECFLRKTPEYKDTILIRRALLDIEITGEFHFEK